MVKPMKKRPRIEKYTDVAAYLRDTYLYHKRNKGLTYQKLGDQVGLTVGAISLILRGIIPFQVEHTRSFSEAFGLSDNEQHFLKLLADYSISDDPITKQAILRAMTRRSEFREMHDIDRVQMAFFSEWYFLAIWELMDTPGFQADPSWIAGRLAPRIRTSQAKEALETLQSLDLISIKNGKVTKKVQDVQTPDEFASEMVGSLHAHMNEIARRALGKFEPAERNFGIVMARMNNDNRIAWLQKVHAVRRELYEYAQSLQTDDGDEVMLTLLQTFPITKVPADDDEEES